MTDKQLLLIKMNRVDDPVFVATDVEKVVITYFVNDIECCLDLHEIRKTDEILRSCATPAMARRPMDGWLKNP
jgi:hypothetical protein